MRRRSRRLGSFRADGPRSGTVKAVTGRGEPLGEAAFTLAPGSHEAEAKFDLPLEIRNQVARIEIAGEHSAGAVYLLDARSGWHRVGIVSGESRGPKIRVFKKKRRKGMRRTKGHRSTYTQIRVKEILV